MLNKDWHAAEKKEDPDFEDSLWELLGYDNLLCPTCNAHLHGGICLNACHLSSESRARFATIMTEVADE
jgi:hypothetical protein